MEAHADPRRRRDSRRHGCRIGSCDYALPDWVPSPNADARPLARGRHPPWQGQRLARSLCFLQPSTRRGPCAHLNAQL